MTTRRSVVSLALVACAGVLAACSSSKPASPSAPSAPAGPAAELRLSSPPSLNLPGDQFRLTLTITNAKITDPGSAAVWRSSAPSVADVSGGDVRVLAAGDATITATFDGLSVETKIAVTDYGALDGVVHELPPTQTRAIAGAAVMVVGGRFDGVSAQTDASGRFHLARVAGALTLRVSHPSFQTRQVDADVAASPALSLDLAPPASTVTESYGFSTGVPATQWTKEDHFSFPVHNPGTIQVTIESWRTPYQGDSGDYLVVELSKGSTMVARLRNCDTAVYGPGFCTSYRLPDGTNLTAEEGQTYTIRIASERSIIEGYRVTVTHPR